MNRVIDLSTGRFKKIYRDVFKLCLACGKKYKARRRFNRKGKFYYSIFCSQKCSHKYQVRENHGGWKCGYHLAHGYYVNSDTGQYMHRDIMEKFLGRKLKKQEVVHHKNHISTDNRIYNLELFPNHSVHMKEHYKSKSSRKKHGEKVWKTRRELCGV